MPLTDKQEREIAGGAEGYRSGADRRHPKLRASQRAQQGLSMIRIAEEVAAYRTRARAYLNYRKERRSDLPGKYLWTGGKL